MSRPIQRGACYNGARPFVCVSFLPLRGSSSVASWPQQSISGPFISSSAPVVITHSPSLSLRFIACACPLSLRRCLAFSPQIRAQSRPQPGFKFPFRNVALCCVALRDQSHLPPSVAPIRVSPHLAPVPPPCEGS